jgi:hypothetical protein
VTYSKLQKKGFSIAKQHELLPLPDRIRIIARTFGCETASVEMSACTGNWLGKTDLSLVLDNGMELWIGTYQTSLAYSDPTVNECVNCALARYHPIIVQEAKELATTALLEREAADNATAAGMGLKPYTFLNVELIGGEDTGLGYLLGWFYVTFAVAGKITGHLESGLACDIARGTVSEPAAKEQYYVAGGLKGNDVDYVFGNVGFSSATELYHVDLSGSARRRAEETLEKRLSIGLFPGAIA